MAAEAREPKKLTKEEEGVLREVFDKFDEVCATQYGCAAWRRLSHVLRLAGRWRQH